MNGVIETASGDLLRAGFSTFVAGEGESLRSDVPQPAKVRGDTDEANMHRWNGSAWVEVTNVLAAPKGFVNVGADPTTTAVFALKGSIITYGAELYRKTTDGDNTDVETIPSLADGEAGKAFIDLPESTSAPTLASGRFWFEDDGADKKLVWSDGVDKYEVTLTKVV